MTRCICCDTPLPLKANYREMLVEDITSEDGVKSIIVEEDMCNICISQSNMNKLTPTLEELDKLPLEGVGLYQPEY